MKTIKKYLTAVMKRQMTFFESGIKIILICGLLTAFLCVIDGNTYTFAAVDRAMEIAKKAKNNVEFSGNELKSTSDKVFKAFAEKTAELQKLMDTRKNLEEAGLLDPNDDLGKARTRNLNAKILGKVAELKEIADSNLSSVLFALDRFDGTVAEAISDSQATRSINSNYELNVNNYLKKEKEIFAEALESAEKYLKECDNGRNKIACERYSRSKQRLERINQRKKLYKARMLVVANNQKFAELVRDQIKKKGPMVSSRLRLLLAKLYITFSKISPIAPVVGKDSSTVFESAGFANMEKFLDTVVVVDDSLDKLNIELDAMVDGVLEGFGNIAKVEGKFVTQDQFSTEEELSYLNKMKQEWK